MSSCQLQAVEVLALCLGICMCIMSAHVQSAQMSKHLCRFACSPEQIKEASDRFQELLDQEDEDALREQQLDGMDVMHTGDSLDDLGSTHRGCDPVLRGLAATSAIICSDHYSAAWTSHWGLA